VAALYVRGELLIDRAAVFVDADSTYSSNLGQTFTEKFESIGGRITDRVSLAGEVEGLGSTFKSVRVGRPELVYLAVKVY